MNAMKLRHVCLLRAGFAGYLSVSVLLAQAQAVLSWDAPQVAGSSGWLRPRIALTGEGRPAILWGRSSPRANLFTIREGSGFAEAIELSMPGLSPSVADWMGSDIAAKGSTIWVVMKATPEESRPLYVRRSDDEGLTWSDTLRVDPFDGLVSRFPSIACEDPEAPIVQYMQFDGGWSGARQVVSRMSAGAFAAPLHVSQPFSTGEVCDCCPGQVVADGALAAALYRDATSSLRVMWGATSMDGGASFPIGAMIDNTGWVLNACPSSGPDGCIAGDSIRYVWMSGASNGTKAYIGSAALETLAAGPQRLLLAGQPTGNQQNHPRLAGAGDTLGVVWEDFSAGARRILFSWSISGPGGLSAPDTVDALSAGNQRTPDIAYAAGRFHIVWGDPGTNTVRYRSASIIGTSDVSELHAPAPLVWVDPGGNAVCWSSAGWRRAELFDAHGRLIGRATGGTSRIHLAGVAAGSYVLRLTATDGSTQAARLAIAHQR
ncbi:MAG: hypothetical protein IPM46_13685 [Flavobacteriales bacterium]|nr:hypothetical protein [Flavobacteriales bacterium]